MINHCEKFVEYLLEEEFEEGAAWAKSEFANASEGSIKSFLGYFHNYLQGRVIVESSYCFINAEEHIAKATSYLLEINDTKFNSDITVLRLLAELQIHIHSIDRAMYTSQENLFFKASQQVMKITNSFEDSSLFPLSEIFKAAHTYAEACFEIAKVLKLRWNNWGKYCEEFKKLDINKSVDKLLSDGQQIMASDLRPHYSVLSEFNQLAENNTSELTVKNGKVYFYYYGSLKHSLSNKGLEAIKEIALESINGEQSDAEHASDIWLSIQDKGYIDSTLWKLPSIAVNLRGKPYSLKADLKYFSIGTFVLKVSIPISDLSIGAIRHMSELSTAFALDNEFKVNGENFYFLNDYATDIFQKLEKTIESFFSESNDKVLYYDTSKFRYTSLRLSDIYETSSQGKRQIFSKELSSHPCLKGLLTKQKEVRCSVDNWIMFSEMDQTENLASIRYNQFESFYVSTHEASAALVDQPDWVVDQAFETIFIIALMINHFQISHHELKQDLSKLHNQLNFTDDQKEDLVFLLKKKNELSSESTSFNEMQKNFSWLQDIIKGGALMTFPDHTDLVREILAKMQFEYFYSNFEESILVVNNKLREVISEINVIEAERKEKANNRMKTLLSLMFAFVSIGAIKDFFDVINNDGELIILNYATRLGILGAITILILLVAFKNGKVDSE